jgi:preprotein translocase subunit Sec63
LSHIILGIHKTDGCERIKRDYNKKSERYWDDEIYHQRSAKKRRIMEEMKNVAETYRICESSETHTSKYFMYVCC